MLVNDEVTMSSWNLPGANKHLLFTCRIYQSDAIDLMFALVRKFQQSKSINNRIVSVLIVIENVAIPSNMNAIINAY